MTLQDWSNLAQVIGALTVVKNRFGGKYPNLERQQLKRGLKRARGGV
jgi:hypothetical protein